MILRQKIFGLSIVATAGSNPEGGMDICLLWL